MTTVAAGTAGEVAGGVAGQALGGVIGGFLGGPVGAWISRAVGGRMGRVAGRAAAQSIASWMEEANEDAETETTEEETDTTCHNCDEIDCFEPPEGADLEEFERQLKEQQDAINNMSPDELIRNMDNYAAAGRPAGDAAARHVARGKWQTDRFAEVRDRLIGNGIDPGLAAAQAESQVAQELSMLDATHDVDLIAGGDGSISGLGDRSVNRSIGSQWRHGRADQLRRSADNARQQGREKMDVTLEMCPQDGDGDVRQPGRRDGGSGQDGGASGSSPPLTS